MRFTRDIIRRGLLAVEMMLVLLSILLMHGESIRFSGWILLGVVLTILLVFGILREVLPDKVAPKKEGLSELGDWVLRKALKPKSSTHVQKKVPAPAPATKTQPGVAVPEEVDQWFNALSHELLRTDEEVAAAYKMECDLNLAKDFQRAYLERPYPSIHAGRLALRFHHYYAPTMTLGG
ncbi:MAG: hypothetical protein V2A34_06135, partial [Lentisphaerota bacterium]